MGCSGSKTAQTTKPEEKSGATLLQAPAAKPGKPTTKPEESTTKPEEVKTVTIAEPAADSVDQKTDDQVPTDADKPSEMSKPSSQVAETTIAETAEPAANPWEPLENSQAILGARTHIWHATAGTSLREAIRQMWCCEESSADKSSEADGAEPAVFENIRLLVAQQPILPPVQRDQADTAKPLFPSASMPPGICKKNVSTDFGRDSDDAEVQPEEECPSRTEAVPENGESPCLELTFVSQGEEKSFGILRSPLGAVFGKNGKVFKVIKVRPESYACELGIEVGWILKEINGEGVSKKPLEEVQEMMKKGLMTLPKYLPKSMRL